MHEPIRQLLRKASSFLQEKQNIIESQNAQQINSEFKTPNLDARILLSFVTKQNYSFLAAHDDISLTEIQEQLFWELIKKRKSGLPIAYITNEKDFWKNTFYVTPDVLIPKPDTEILVELAINKIKKLYQKNKASFTNTDIFKTDQTETTKVENTNAIKILDLCTGSGCIAISLAEEAQSLSIPVKIIATDISQKTLDVAKINAKKILLDQTKENDRFFCIDFMQGNLFDAIEQTDNLKDDKFDIIVTNPPYVTTITTSELLKDGRNEPRLALDGGNDGLDLIYKIIDNAPKYLSSEGIILLESSQTQTDIIKQYFKHNHFSDIVVHKDLAGQNRVTEAYYDKRNKQPRESNSNIR